MLSDNRSTLRSDEKLQKLMLDELKPHNAQITLVEYEPGWSKLFEDDGRQNILIKF